MPYFRINASSMHFCGFDSTFYVECESEDAFYNTKDYHEIEDHMYDYISGYSDEDDEENYEDPNEISMFIEEISEEEYNNSKQYDNRYHG